MWEACPWRSWRSQSQNCPVETQDWLSLDKVWRALQQNVLLHSIRSGLMWQVICLSSSLDFLLDLKFFRKITKFSQNNLESRAILPDLLNSPRVTLAIPRFIWVLVSLSRKYCAAILTCSEGLTSPAECLVSSPGSHHQLRGENRNWHIPQTVPGPGGWPTYVIVYNI